MSYQRLWPKTPAHEFRPPTSPKKQIGALQVNGSGAEMSGAPGVLVSLDAKQ